jgi:ArsR family metal-binding transcriptional regulator
MTFMNNDLFTTTFPAQEELNQAVMVLESMGAAYKRIEPSPALTLVALPALVMSREVRGRLEEKAPTIIFSGWVEYHASPAVMPDIPSPEEKGVCFQRAVIMVLGPCVADEVRIRLIAHLEGDLGPVLPYLNAVIPQASYEQTPEIELLTFMKGYRLIVLYRNRITIARADDIVDAWMILEDIRQLAEQTWKDRNQIQPCYETRMRQSIIEIFKRLPRTNCRRCGEPTCLAFAVRVWKGEASVRLCLPVFEESGSFSQLREAILEICAGMGITAGKHW